MKKWEDFLPTKCPDCGSALDFDDVHLICSNKYCVGRIAKQLSGALGVLNIQRIGGKTIEPFAYDFKNMYEIIKWVKTKGHTEDIEKYGIKYNSRSHQIFLDAFNNIKSLTYEQVIRMLGYDNVGKKISIQLSKEHAGLDYNYAHLEKALVEKIRSPEISNYIKKVVKGLEDLGIKIDRPEVPKENSSSFGVCMTGSPKTFGYKTKAEFLAKFPNLFESSLSSIGCRYLITDDLNSTSSKMKIAEKKGIEIKTYGDFKI